eukprot:921125-Rhodomonas_salina.1
MDGAGGAHAHTGVVGSVFCVEALGMKCAVPASESGLREPEQGARSESLQGGHAVRTLKVEALRCSVESTSVHHEDSLFLPLTGEGFPDSAQFCRSQEDLCPCDARKSDSTGISSRCQNAPELRRDSASAFCQVPTPPCASSQSGLSSRGGSSSAADTHSTQPSTPRQRTRSRASQRLRNSLRPSTRPRETCAGSCCSDPGRAARSARAHLQLAARRQPRRGGVDELEDRRDDLLGVVCKLAQHQRCSSGFERRGVGRLVAAEGDEKKGDGVRQRLSQRVRASVRHEGGDARPCEHRLLRDQRLDAHVRRGSGTWRLVCLSVFRLEAPEDRDRVGGREAREGLLEQEEQARVWHELRAERDVEHAPAVRNLRVQPFEASLRGCGGEEARDACVVEAR